MTMIPAGTTPRTYNIDDFAHEVRQMAVPEAPAKHKRSSALVSAFRGVATILEYGAYTGVLLAGLTIVADDQRQKGPSPYAREQILKTYQALEQRIFAPR